jgi:AcrR family transcriptional regulator
MSTYALPMPEPIQLPLAEAPRTERADAARNRAALLEATNRLLHTQGVDAITMDAVACEAGVGKGTLFRRFGDRASLFRALLDEGDRQFQEGFIRGPAPLGPGAPASERLIAFGHGLLDLIECHGEILVAAEAGTKVPRLGHPVYLSYRTHVRGLLASAIDADRADHLCDFLLAGLAPAFVMYQRHTVGLSLEQLKDGWEDVVRSLL